MVAGRVCVQHIARRLGRGETGMAVVRSSRGLDLPLAGAPSGTIEAARMVSSVALLGPDGPTGMFSNDGGSIPW